jgi:lipoprotein LenA
MTRDRRNRLTGHDCPEWLRNIPAISGVDMKKTAFFMGVYQHCFFPLQSCGKSVFFRHFRPLRGQKRKRDGVFATALMILMVAVLAAAGCGRREGQSDAEKPALATRFAKYPVNVFRDAEMKTWMATLSVAEPVEVISAETPVTVNNQAVQQIKVRLSTGDEGYMDSKHLALKIVAITGDQVEVYHRNNEMSGVAGKLDAGTIAMVVDEKANWIQVDVFSPKQLYHVWLEEGASSAAGDVKDALELARQSAVLSGAQKGDRKKAQESLEKLAGGNGVFAGKAAEVLKKQGESEKSGEPAGGKDGEEQKQGL